MISLVEPQTAGSPPGLVSQIEEIFSPAGLLSKSRNFEYRPQQQQMAVAVARALGGREEFDRRGRHGRGQEPGLFDPLHSFRRRAAQEGDHLHAHDQFAGATDPKGPADAGPDVAGEIPIHHAQRPAQLSMPAPSGQGLRSRANSFSPRPDMQELRRIYEWSQKTEDGSLSDFEIEPDPQCLAASLFRTRPVQRPRLCGHGSDFVKNGGQPCFYQRARSDMLAADVLVLNHTLFFTLMGGQEEEPKGGILLKNDFVVFDEAHTVERVASGHIGIERFPRASPLRLATALASDTRRRASWPCCVAGRKNASKMR